MKLPDRIYPPGIAIVPSAEKLTAQHMDRMQNSSRKTSSGSRAGS